MTREQVKQLEHGDKVYHKQTHTVWTVAKPLFWKWRNVQLKHDLFTRCPLNESTMNKFVVSKDECFNPRKILTQKE